jgi:hypothetical protein
MPFVYGCMGFALGFVAGLALVVGAFAWKGFFS